MKDNSNAQKFKSGLIKGAISLALGIISVILALTCGIWILMLFAAAPLALIGLFFGVIGLSSTGKGKYLAVTGIVVCSLAFVASLYLLFGGWSVIFD